MKRGIVLATVLLMVPVAIFLMMALRVLIDEEARFVRLRYTQAQALYLAEAGVNISFLAFANANYELTTHQPDGSTVSPAPALTVDYPDMSKDASGFYAWDWTPASGHASFSGTGLDEHLEVQVYYPEPARWRILSRAQLGSTSRVVVLEGRLEGLFEYAIFDAGDLSEFVRGANQTVRGKVHANGNLFFRPSGANLDIYSSEVTAAGEMIRSRDAWGRPAAGGRVRISKGGATGSLVEMPLNSSGQPFDSQHPNWAQLDSSGALARWGNSVRDGQLGVGTRNPIGVESLNPGGYYDQKAGLRIDEATPTSDWLSVQTFFNQAEQREISVREIDVAALEQAGAFPANGLLYSTVPIRLVNADSLPRSVTIAANASIYTRGDFNKEFPDQDALNQGDPQHKSAALLTSGRIYHLSEAFDDSASYGAPIPVASDPSSFPGDPDGRIEINAALVDGPPTVDEQNWRETYKGQSNPYYDPVHRSGKNAWANSDDFLEDLRGTTVRKRGSIVHLQRAQMAAFDNSNAGEGATPWVVKTHYQAPNRDYGYDEVLRQEPPPFTPRVSHKISWQVID